MKKHKFRTRGRAADFYSSVSRVLRNIAARISGGEGWKGPKNNPKSWRIDGREIRLRVRFWFLICYFSIEAIFDNRLYRYGYWSLKKKKKTVHFRYLHADLPIQLVDHRKPPRRKPRKLRNRNRFRNSNPKLPIFGVVVRGFRSTPTLLNMLRNIRNTKDGRPPDPVSGICALNLDFSDPGPRLISGALA